MLLYLKGCLPVQAWGRTEKKAKVRRRRHKTSQASTMTDDLSDDLSAASPAREVWHTSQAAPHTTHFTPPTTDSATRLWRRRMKLAAAVPSASRLIPADVWGAIATAIAPTCRRPRAAILRARRRCERPLTHSYPPSTYVLACTDTPTHTVAGLLLFSLGLLLIFMGPKSSSSSQRFFQNICEPPMSLRQKSREFLVFLEIFL